jgi:predicted xylose isomerase-like sugar epimerase
MSNYRKTSLLKDYYQVIKSSNGTYTINLPYETIAVTKTLIEYLKNNGGKTVFLVPVDSIEGKEFEKINELRKTSDQTNMELSHTLMTGLMEAFQDNWTKVITEMIEKEFDTVIVE